MLLVLLCSGCNNDAIEDDRTFSVLSYNVQNLFDARHDGSEYEEYVPSKKWTELSYRMRLRTLSSVLTSKSVAKADVIVLQEIENARVVEDLLSLHLGRKGYRWFASTGESGGAIEVAIITKIKPSLVLVHDVPGARPVLEAVFPTNRGDVVVFALHAKSQLEGMVETENQRIELAKSLKIAASAHPDDLVLFCGDFNEDPPQENSSSQTALVHESHPRSVEYSNDGSLLVTGHRTSLGPDLWYNPFLDDKNTFSVPGSCNWGGIWHRYDQILGNGYLFDDLGWEFSSFRIATPSRCMQSDGMPFAWKLATLNGVSDHLPVEMTLTCK